MTDIPVCFFWFRRDLRLHDNHGLFQALQSGKKVIPVFILDKEILNDLTNKKDRRVAFILETLQAMQTRLRTMHSDIVVIHETPLDAWKKIYETYGAADIYTNRDYEPYAQNRDTEIAHFALKNGQRFLDFKDQVIFERDEINKDDGSPYTVYTPYSKKWKAIRNNGHFAGFESHNLLQQLFTFTSRNIPEAAHIGFEKTASLVEKPNLAPAHLTAYVQTRDIPSLNGTSRVSVHLRFGTVSIRELFQTAEKYSEKWMNELIWREFYMQILWHFPRVINQAFQSKYDRMVWRNNEVEFAAWCAGKTGYPLVDAGMRELNATGFMHNRVRMIVASFLTKHLLVDWRWGEAYFAEKLLDFDLANNNGGWQWAAGCGVDAAPYFRIFNPYIQTKKFDPELKYIRRWVPEWDSLEYPQPLVNHEFARDRCLKAYKSALDR